MAVVAIADSWSVHLLPTDLYSIQRKREDIFLTGSCCNLFLVGCFLFWRQIRIGCHHGKFHFWSWQWFFNFHNHFSNFHASQSSTKCNPTKLKNCFYFAVDFNMKWNLTKHLFFLVILKWFHVRSEKKNWLKNISLHPFPTELITIKLINKIYFDIFPHKWHKIKDSLSL